MKRKEMQSHPGSSRDRIQEAGGRLLMSPMQKANEAGRAGIRG